MFQDSLRVIEEEVQFRCAIKRLLLALKIHLCEFNFIYIKMQMQVAVRNFKDPTEKALCTVDRDTKKNGSGTSIQFPRH